jgi:2-polyprenyl-6-methoxyphenol hydroxylase-like FAD-dependent oxidoreductase
VRGVDVAIIGGSVTGLWTALTLARAGHGVTVFERDPAPPGDAAGAVLGWQRPGTPQLRQSHAFLARTVHLVREEAPDLYAALRDEGAHVFRAADHLPPWIADRAPRPSDDEVVTMSVRRPVFDRLLHEHAVREGVRVDRRGAAGLVTEGGDVPHVTGVGLDDGSAYAADVVVDASGRRSRTPRWLGVAFPESGNECGNRYYTRYYETLPGEEPPALMRGFTQGGEGDAYATLVFQGDGRSFSVPLQTEDDDEPARVLREPAAFDAVARLLPVTAGPVAVGRPLNDPSVMAGQRNLVRRAVREGRPVATGVLLAGDAAATSNPSYGRGVSLGLVSAALVRDALAHTDPGDQVLALDAAVEREVAPFVRNAADVDTRTRARWRAALYGEPAPPRPERVLWEDLFAGAMRERDLFDALVRGANLLRTPDEILATEAGRIRAATADGWEPPLPPLPTRDELVAAATAAVA